MYKIASFLSLFFIFLMLSCSNETENSGDIKSDDSIETIYQTSVKKIETELLEEQKQDVFQVEKKAVIFFILSKSEAKTLAKEIGENYRWETETLLNGFVKQSESFKNILKKHNIQCFLSNNKRFDIILKKGKTFTFDRMEKDQIMGTIISDGEKQPVICYGMYRNKELAGLIQDFYGIKDLGNVEPDSLTLGYDNHAPNDSIN